MSRRLHWEGCFNARDLGGLRAEGGTIRRRAIVRADSLDQLTPAGWDAVLEHGVRTILDLRNPDERGPVTGRPTEIRTVHLPLDEIEDRVFWDVWSSGWQFGTPLYYAPHVERFPHRSGAVLRALSTAPDGGVIYHCSAGRDRTGLITMLLLALLEVAREEIVADYLLSHDVLGPLFERRREPDQTPIIRAFLAERGTSPEVALLDALDGIDFEQWRSEGGLSDADVARLRVRLLVPTTTG